MATRNPAFNGVVLDGVTRPPVGVGLKPAQQEVIDYIVDVNGSNLRYSSFNVSTGETTVLKTFAVGATVYSVATDGTFVFTGGSSQLTKQFTWDGSTFTSVLSATPTGCINTASMIYVDPVISNRIWHNSTGSLGLGECLSEYQTAPTYSYTVKDLSTADPVVNYSRDRWGDMRFDGRTTGYGETLLSFPSESLSGRGSYCMKASTSTITFYAANSSAAAGSGGMWAFDRENAVAARPRSTTTVEIWTVNTSTKALTLAGVSSAVATSDSACFVNGVFVAHGTDGTIRTYTRSGTTLTLADSIASGSTGVGGFVVSPYSKAVYFANGTISKAYSVDSSGTITALGTSSIQLLSSTYIKAAFSEQPLVAS